MNKQRLTEWRNGEPPMIGEYNASMARDPRALRWWNGTHWSSIYYDNFDEENKRRVRREKSAWSTVRIEWRGLAEKPANFVEPKPLEPLK